MAMKISLEVRMERRFKASKFKQMLQEIHKYPMNMQKELLERHFEEWKGELRQVDDIVVAGICFQRIKVKG